MGLPEVADFARNFAVMVRVQGPDPKGMKMRNHAFHHYNSGRTTLSASGMVYLGSNQRDYSSTGDDTKSSGTILVLTVASVIEPFLVQQHRESTLEEKPRLIAGVQIDVLLESKYVVEGDDEVANTKALPWMPAELINTVSIPDTSCAVQSLIEASCGSIENCWEVGWALASHSRGPQHVTGNSHAQVEQSSFRSQWNNMVGAESEANPCLMGQSATTIALLKIPVKKFAGQHESLFIQNFWKLQTSDPKRGDLLLAMGSPFGILSPVHFFNNISVGSVGNSYPPNSVNRSLLMADIRCLPGMEGSPVFNEHSQFVGLLTRPLRQKTSGTEIQLVIPWEAIASSCSDLLHEEPHITRKEIDDLNTVGEILPEHYPVDKAINSICLITTDDGSWASGVVLNKQGLILTNAHLLEPWRFGKTSANGEINETNSYVSTENVKALDILIQRGVRVRLDCVDPWIWVDANVVYISKGPLDVALLQIENIPDQLYPISVDFGCPSPGSKAYVIGHGLFGPRCDFLPSACLGVIAKVIEAKRPQTHQPNLLERFPAMIETTAAVHPGSSGGAVVNSDGRMIGLVTSNAKHGGGTVIPHLNFSIPSAALESIFEFAKDMQDFSILEELNKPNKNLSSVWALMPPLYPKPAPSLLPDRSQIPSQDNNVKDTTKGSRFAKFIAERNDLLKKNGMDRNELLPSKL